MAKQKKRFFLFALGIAPVHAEMRPGDRVRAILDDVYVISPPPRVSHLFGKLQHHLFAQVRRKRMERTSDVVE